MAESRAAWEQVGEEFRALGRQVKERYEQQPRPQGAEAQHGEGPPPADRRKVDEALQKLTESLEQAFGALGEAVRDPRFGEQTRKAAGSLSDALNATFAEASERFRKR
jgi:hypothetical protein